ncbi:unnamed protein product, partial [Prorocentrum cordatum]
GSPVGPSSRSTLVAVPLLVLLAAPLHLSKPSRLYSFSKTAGIWVLYMSTEPLRSAMPPRAALPLAAALASTLAGRGAGIHSSLREHGQRHRGAAGGGGLGHGGGAGAAGHRAAVRHIGSISIVTVETRAGDPMRLPGRNSGNNSDAEVENLGAGQPWNYYRTKNGLMLEWLSKAVEKDPDAMAIMIDGGDMVFGGCDESFLMSKYQKILSASGGGPNMKMVMGAETACFPFHNAKFFRDNSTWEGRRSAVNRQVENLADDWVLPWSPCGDTKIAPCDPEPQRAYRYPNWGFVMGPVKDLQPLFEFVYNQGSNQVLDQALAQWWMVTHPDRITLDYAGSMVLSLHQWPTGGQTVVRPSRSEGGSGPRARKGGPSFSTRSPSSRAALRMATATAWLSSERLRGA